MRHLGKIDDLTTDEIVEILDRADAMRRGVTDRKHVGRVLTLAFFQSSTRTRVGFAAAGIRLGFGTVDLWTERYDQTMSGAESLSDTIRVVSAYSDVVVLRHSAADAWKAAEGVSRCPLINGGNGCDEHPTQALIDLYAIRLATGRIDRLAVGIVGDIRGSRSAHSLMKVLGRFSPLEIRLMGPASRVDSDLAGTWVGGLSDGSVTVIDHINPRDLDFVYFTGLPAGSGTDSVDMSTRACFALSPERLRDWPETTAILCPLPRIDEIACDVDRDARARYFSQSDAGIWVRMALLDWRMGGATRGENHE